MLAGTPIAYWIGFHAIALALMVGDLALLNREPAENRRASRNTSRSNLLFVLFLFAAAAAFAIWLAHVRGLQTGLEFSSGYLIELSLSVDNLFVFLVMFRAFGLGPAEQRKALLLGVLGAIVMRGLFIFGGIALLARFSWIQYIFGGLILIAAVRLARESAASRPKRWMAWSWFTQRESGSRTRLLLSAVIAIEVVDLVFALDSIPAVLAVTNDPFVAYTSNIFAVLGLRSLYFLLAEMLDRLRFLHLGLAAILGFVGCKMILTRWVHVPIAISLGVILLLMAIATAASLLYPAKPSRKQEQLQ